MQWYTQFTQTAVNCLYTLLYPTDIICQFPPVFHRYSRANRKLLTLLVR